MRVARTSKWVARATQQLLTLVLVSVIGAMAGATLIRFAPGFGVDEREIDPRYGEQTLKSFRDAREQEQNILVYYVNYLGRIAQGDFGVSHSLNRPVSELLTERLPVTFGSVGRGLIAAWVMGLALALPSIARVPVYNLVSGIFNGLLLCLPPGVLALGIFALDKPVDWVFALSLLPKVYRYASSLLTEAYAAPHILTAKAKGLGVLKVLYRHVLPVTAPQMAALVAVTVNVGLGVAVPIEVVCDSPGVGQLAWQAAVARDLPILVAITLLITTITLIASSSSDLLGRRDA
jgi:peptide/nickel transport system permease protein